MWIKALAAAGLVAASGVAGAGVASANEGIYLQVLRDEYWTRSFSDVQLLQEGYKVCKVSTYPTLSIAKMVAADLGISDIAAAGLVGAAQGGLGC